LQAKPKIPKQLKRVSGHFWWKEPRDCKLKHAYNKLNQSKSCGTLKTKQFWVESQFSEKGKGDL